MKKSIIFSLLLIFFLANLNFAQHEDDEIPENLADDDGDDSSEQVQEIKESPYVRDEDEEEDQEPKSGRVPSIADIKMASIAFAIAFLVLILLWLCALHVLGYNKLKIPGKKKVVLCGNRSQMPTLQDIEAPKSKDPLFEDSFKEYNQKYNEATKLLWTNNQNKMNTLSGKSSNSNASTVR